jgi:carbonic anhydrase/acetyltransferase-like protein (isoleucine patch superfamily)
MSHVHIGRECVVGHSSIVLYDTHLEPGAQLHSLSLLMKGETLPTGTHWQGIPAQPLLEKDVHPPANILNSIAMATIV